MNNYIPYREIIDYFPIKEGDIVYISSEIMGIMFWCKENGEQFLPDEFINTIIDKIGSSGTLLLPTFNFDFSNKGVYDYIKTKGVVGTLGNVALKRKDFKRTWHPMHSFAVSGKDKELLCGMKNSNSFGNDSPFEYLHKNNAIQLIINTDYKKSMTFVHYVEACLGVPYRYNKIFTGNYTDENGITKKIECDYPARNLEINPVEKFNRLGKILEKDKVASKYEINNMNFYLINLGESYPVIEYDLKYNYAKNLYDFSVDRSEVFSGKFSINN